MFSRRGPYLTDSTRETVLVIKTQTQLPALAHVCVPQEVRENARSDNLPKSKLSRLSPDITEGSLQRRASPTLDRQRHIKLATSSSRIGGATLRALSFPGPLHRHRQRYTGDRSVLERPHQFNHRLRCR